MTPELSKLRTINHRVLLPGILVVLSVMQLGVVSGCSGGNPFAEKQYTILLHTFSGPEHVRQSKYCRDATKKLAGWSSLELVHKDNNSELYWGKYSSIPSANPDLKTARTWVAPKANRPIFPFPKVVLVPGKEIEMPEYDLLNVSGGYWTVLVAIFSDDPSQGFIGRDRQKHALEYCTWLREKGYEAYYHHSSGRSRITIGTFPENAVAIESQSNSSDRLIVAKQVVKSEKMRKILTTADPPLRFLVINDHTEYQKRLNKKTGKMVKVIVGSYPIPIPKNKSSNSSSFGI